MDLFAPGIYKAAFGEPETNTPVHTRLRQARLESLAELPACNGAPFDAPLRYRQTPRGCCVELPLGAEEQLYGFGLQLKSFNQRGKKKQIRVNADPQSDSGDSHAPVPFFVSTKGYGVMVDTFRYATFYCGCNQKNNRREGGARAGSQGDCITIEIPHVGGVELYIFCGPGMMTAVQRYILFSGGGCLPPMWGLGVLYRAYAKANKDDVVALANLLRRDRIPCDVIGLEPGWQSHSYPCSLEWDAARFADHDEMTGHLRAMGFRLNLWEHAFIGSSSPLHDPLRDRSGDYAVWGGLVPDLFDDKVQQLLSGYHSTVFVRKGVSAFKLDECDNSDYTGGWSFPECSEFPSGVDGEQMHSMFGMLYQKAILSAFETKNERTFGQVRSSHALAAPLPFVLYSDLYDHGDFIRAVANSGFSGLLWSPEVRQCSSREDLLLRIQTAVFSALTCFNSWMIPNPPWMQFDLDKNSQGVFLEDEQELMCQCRSLLELRMSLLPYLYSAYADYYLAGIPPLRALVLDYQDDCNTYAIDDQYMMGDAMLVAPVTAGNSCRQVYLPRGKWYCFWTGKEYEGGQMILMNLQDGKIPVFIKDGTLLPLAQPLSFVDSNTRFDITVLCYGEGFGKRVLYEDDWESLDFQKGIYNTVELSYDGVNGGQVLRQGNCSASRYVVSEWRRIG